MDHVLKDDHKCGYHYIYCNDILGVKTNIEGFSWIYGSTSRNFSCEEYEKCKVKFRIILLKESELDEILMSEKRFQSFSWNEEKNTLKYRRTFGGNISVGYSITITDDEIIIFVGKHYYNLVKGRIMNLHGMYYLLSDLANIMLLNKGYVTLYASSVYFSGRDKGVVFFAPPNTGKSFTATKLCCEDGNQLVGEDIVITDLETIYSCPYTKSSRNKTSALDSAGSLIRVNTKADNYCEACNLTDFVVLSLGKQLVLKDKNAIKKQIEILNGYLFQEYSSPIVKVIEYFDSAYSNQWYDQAASMLSRVCDNVNCVQIQSEHPEDFGMLITNEIMGNCE